MFNWHQPSSLSSIPKAYRGPRRQVTGADNKPSQPPFAARATTLLDTLVTAHHLVELHEAEARTGREAERGGWGGVGRAPSAIAPSLKKIFATSPLFA